MLMFKPETTFLALYTLEMMRLALKEDKTFKKYSPKVLGSVVGGTPF